MRTPEHHRGVAAVVAACLLLAFGLTTAACGSSNDAGAPSSTTSGTTGTTAGTTPGTTAGTVPGSVPGTTRATTSTTAAPTSTGAQRPSTMVPTTAPAPRQLAVDVFFVRDAKVATAGRSVALASPARGAVEALLAGPAAVETGAGMSTAIPAGTTLLGVDIDRGVATVDLSGGFAAGASGPSMQDRVAQVVFTLTQFPSVGSVTFRLDGAPASSIGDVALPARGLTRADLTDVTPNVLVVSPVPGATVRSPFALSGISNTYEATVNYTLTDPDGNVVAENWVLATSGTGTWGTFETPVSFSTTRTGTFTLRAFEVSAKDGAPINVYEVPLQVG